MKNRRKRAVARGGSQCSHGLQPQPLWIICPLSPSSGGLDTARLQPGRHGPYKKDREPPYGRFSVFLSMIARKDAQAGRTMPKNQFAKKTEQAIHSLLRCGTPEGTRTPSLQNRNLTLYPIALRARCAGFLPDLTIIASASDFVKCKFKKFLFSLLQPPLPLGTEGVAVLAGPFGGRIGKY